MLLQKYVWERLAMLNIHFIYLCSLKPINTLPSVYHSPSPPTMFLVQVSLQWNKHNFSFSVHIGWPRFNFGISRVTPKVFHWHERWSPFLSNFGLVKLYKSLHNAVDVENLLPQIKLFESINILLFFDTDFNWNFSVILSP